jgi:predicted GNAT family N-acyltransferase
METSYSIRIVRWSEARPMTSPVREAVFMREQGVPAELEWDEFDADALHAVAADIAGQPVGTARLLADGHIGRMAVLAPWRRRGVGSAMLARLMGSARDRGLGAVFLHAQMHAVPFYRRHGFVVEGAEFLDAGILHVSMRSHLHAGADPLAADDKERP